jgi:hypothetical protein
MTYMAILGSKRSLKMAYFHFPGRVIFTLTTGLCSSFCENVARDHRAGGFMVVSSPCRFVPSPFRPLYVSSPLCFVPTLDTILSLLFF